MFLARKIFSLVDPSIDRTNDCQNVYQPPAITLLFCGTELIPHGDGRIAHTERRIGYSNYREIKQDSVNKGWSFLYERGMFILLLAVYFRFLILCNLTF